MNWIIFFAAPSCIELYAMGCAVFYVSPKLRHAPVCQSLALQVMKILFFPVLLWSMMVRQSALITRALMD